MHSLLKEQLPEGQEPASTVENWLDTEVSQRDDIVKE
jgi:hypothetical protein